MYILHALYTSDSGMRITYLPFNNKIIQDIIRLHHTSTTLSYNLDDYLQAKFGEQTCLNEEDYERTLGAFDTFVKEDGLLAEHVTSEITVVGYIEDVSYC
jgi:hypothetical protein